ncbi:MAG: hypothetical protein AAFQ83_06105 [Bacteroidota bacterium]
MKNRLFLLLTVMIAGWSLPTKGNMNVPHIQNAIADPSVSEISPTFIPEEMNRTPHPSWVLGLGGLANYSFYGIIYFALGSLGNLALLAIAGWLVCGVFAWIWGIRSWKRLNKAKWKKPQRKIWAKIGIVAGLFLATIPVVLTAFVAALSEIGFLVFGILILGGMLLMRRNSKRST